MCMNVYFHRVGRNVAEFSLYLILIVFVVSICFQLFSIGFKCFAVRTFKNA